MLVTDQMLNDVDARISGHPAHCLATMRYLRGRFPGVPQVACSTPVASGSILPMPAVASRGASSKAVVPADELKSIATAALRCAEPAPISAVIHLFPTAAPQRKIATAVARRA